MPHYSILLIAFQMGSRYSTNEEILFNCNPLLFLLDKKVTDQKFTYEEFVDIVPGMVHLNSSKDFSLELINNQGAIDLGREKEELYNMGDNFTVKHLHPSSISKNARPLLNFYSNGNNNNTYQFLQEFRSSISSEYKILLSTTKICGSKEAFITVSATPNELSILSKKLKGIIEEEYFVFHNWPLFQTLTRREIEVLGYLASGSTSNIISEKLFISKHTVSTHRKNIFRKLNAKNLFEIIRFAKAFDLIDDYYKN